MSCHFPGSSYGSMELSTAQENIKHHCCFPGCDDVVCPPIRMTSRMHEYCFLRSNHEKNHYSQGQVFQCREEHCSTTTKNSSDLVRHYSSRHCTAPKPYSCHHIGCKHSGENGFPRKDKLTSHLKNGHKNDNPRGRPLLIIKPKSSDKA